MAGARLSVEFDGLQETIQALTRSQEALARKETNAQLRDAARQCATVLAAKLARAAAGSGVPVAPRVARSIRVKSDRMPVVSIGPAAGRSGKPSSALTWGSEQGPKGSVNHFAVPPSAGYWIKPTVEAFNRDDALEIYARGITNVFREQKLL